MRPRLRPISFAILLAGACGPRDADSGFGTTPGITSNAMTTSSGSTSSSTGDVSTTSSSGDSDPAGGTTVIFDAGDLPDGGNPQPAGCKGKIDFLFVISRGGDMGKVLEGYGTIHERLIAAIPKFFDTIETKFADFDSHILVTDGDPYWGSSYCNQQCPGPFMDSCQPGDAYPCEMVGKLPACELTWGAGAVFNAGWLAPNKPCEIAGGRRYLTKDQPNLAETFACIAQVGASGYYLIAQALVAAVGSDLNGPGGCNEGFLRDDALLVVTLVTNDLDNDSEGTPSSWAQAVFDAKGGDPDAVVMFFVGPPSLEYCEDPPWENWLCEMFNEFPHRAAVSALAQDYGPAFDEATDLVAEVCASFIPG